MPLMSGYSDFQVTVAATPPSQTSSAEIVGAFFSPLSCTSSSSTTPVEGREREEMVPAPRVPTVSGESCCSCAGIASDARSDPSSALEPAKSSRRTAERESEGPTSFIATHSAWGSRAVTPTKRELFHVNETVSCDSERDL
eukprot:scaffold114962_cov30-Tisochrysis_lutea.AAC.3